MDGKKGDTNPADGEQQSRPIRADVGEAEPELPIEQVFPDKGDQAERHGGRKHVKDACHVVDIQLAAHDLVLLVVANACQPQGFQLLHLSWKMNTKGKATAIRIIHS